MSRKYSQKQIDKYNRQKYITAINKCTKNLYKLFKDEHSLYKEYSSKFTLLKKELDKFKTIRLDTEHLKKSKEYIDNLYIKTVINNINEDEYKALKSSELSMLNRLQKMKNRVKYSKGKHKQNFS